MIDPSGYGDYGTIDEALASVTERFPGKELVMRLSAGTHVVGGLVLDANLTLGSLEITAASDASTMISSSVSTLLKLRAGAPPLKLQGLELDGQVVIEGGTAEIEGCRFGSESARRQRRLAAGTELRALLISDGQVLISNAVFEGLLGGAIEVSGGTLAVHNSTFDSNQAESGGALLVTGGNVHVNTSMFKDNKVTDGSSGSGGAIRVSGTNAKLELAELTTITGSTGYGGSVASDVEWTFRLPAPLAHYVSDPEQDGIARNGRGTYDYDYPIPCSATLYGNSYDVKDQAAPSCSGSCTAGNYCGRQTVNPAPCRAGTFCPQEAAAETPCPAGTYNPNELATSIKACLVCNPGTFCPERSKHPVPCTPGTYGPEPGQEACHACESGLFQENSSQIACEACKPGSYCSKRSEDQGATAPTECKPGTFSNATNLTRAEECDECPPGFYCEEGETEPQPCPAGKKGMGANLFAERSCTTCPTRTTSLPGTTSCNFCDKNYFKSSEDEAKVKCTPCPEDGATCLENTTLGATTLTHGSTSLATIRIEPNYWRLSATSSTISLCLSSANGHSSCVGGNDAGDEDEFKLGYAGSGYCKEGHTGPLCRVCSTFNFYFDSAEAMECVQCPKASERLKLPLGIIGLILGLLLAAFLVKRFALRLFLSLNLHLHTYFHTLQFLRHLRLSLLCLICSICSRLFQDLERALSCYGSRGEPAGHKIPAAGDYAETQAAVHVSGPPFETLPARTRCLSSFPASSLADSSNSSRKFQPRTMSSCQGLLETSTQTQPQFYLGPPSSGTVHQLTHT